MVEQTTRYGLATRVSMPYESAVQTTREELAKEGFGVLTEIDVAATLKTKLGVEFRPYRILGACNPPLAHQALSAELDIGLLLPCNVVIYEADDPGECTVAAFDPVAGLALTGNEQVRPIGEAVRARLERVLAAVEERGTFSRN